MLTLIWIKNKYAKVVKVWSIILIIGPGLIVLGIIIGVLAEGDLSSKIEKLAQNIIIIIIGLLVYHFNQKTVEVKSVTKD